MPGLHNLECFGWWLHYLVWFGLMPSGLVEPAKCFLFIVVPLGETQLQSGIYYALFNFFIWKAINFVIMMKCILIILISSFDCLSSHSSELFICTSFISWKIHQWSHYQMQNTQSWYRYELPLLDHHLFVFILFWRLQYFLLHWVFIYSTVLIIQSSCQF